MMNYLSYSKVVLWVSGTASTDFKVCGHPLNRWWESTCVHSFVTMGSRISALVMGETARRGQHTHFTHSIELPAIMQ